MITGPQRKFCEGIVRGLSASEAYAEAYPKAKPAEVAKNTTRLTKKDEIQAEIQRMRDKADKLKGSAVMVLAEKRAALAEVVRTDQPILRGAEVTWPVKLKAIEVDNDLAGDGSEASAHDELRTAISAMLVRICEAK